MDYMHSALTQRRTIWWLPIDGVQAAARFAGVMTVYWPCQRVMHVPAPPMPNSVDSVLNYLCHDSLPAVAADFSERAQH